jgi:hypothetical protein
MPDQARAPRRVRRVALLAGAVALTALLAIPGIGLAQTGDTSTTTVVEEAETTIADQTDTTAATDTDSGSDTTTDNSQGDRPARGDGNCDHAEDTSTSEA